MRKDLGQKTWFYPLPVLIVATYNDDGSANAMNAAWGGVYAADKVVLRLNHGHKTVDNIKAKQAFTVSFADAANLVASDYVGIVSGHDVGDKIARAGWHVTKSAHVDAPLIDELPLTLECILEKINEDGNVIGKVVNVSVDEGVLDADGLPDLGKFQPLIYEPAHHDYYALGARLADAFTSGNALK